MIGWALISAPALATTTYDLAMPSDGATIGFHWTTDDGPLVLPLFVAPGAFDSCAALPGFVCGTASFGYQSLTPPGGSAQLYSRVVYEMNDPTLGFGVGIISFFSGDVFGKPGVYTESYFNTGAVLTITSDALPPAPGVPEPAGWTMLIAGFGLVGAALRRRRGVTA
jgi:hypothetical protein